MIGLSVVVSRDVDVMVSSKCCQTVRNNSILLVCAKQGSRVLEIVLFVRPCLLTTLST